MELIRHPIANGIGMRTQISVNNVLSGFIPQRTNMLLCLVAVALTSLTLGCGDTTPVQVSQSEVAAPVEPSAADKEVTTSVAVSATKTEVSPAVVETKLPATDASPEAVCQLFMRYLNSGERVKAERLLTSVAFDTTAKAGLYLQPMGSAEAEVEIQAAFYVTNKQQLAHVPCTITEIEDGIPVKDELTWMVRKSKSGWRIFGMLLTLEEGQQDFLSLENAQDVDAILQMSGDNASTRQAKANAEAALN